MKRLYSILFLASFVLAGCSGKSETVTESLLWKVSGNGLESPSYLFGTHHFASIDILDSYPSLKKAVASCMQVVGEVHMDELMDSQMTMIEYATMPEGTTYEDILTMEEYEKLDEFLKANLGAGLEQFGGFKPAMISTMYTAFSYMQADPSFDPSTHEPIDTYIQNLALEDGKEIIGLETVEEQMNILMNSESVEAQAKSLLCSVENDDKLMQNILNLNEAYENGELQKMYDMSFNDPDDPCPTSEEFNFALNKKRNDNWLTRLPSIMQGGPSFVAVGAIHLAGEPGLVNRLREMGYTVEAIK